MHCSCCDRILSDYESTLRRKDTKEFVDVCSKCLKDIPIDTESNYLVEEDRGLDEDEVYSTDFTLDLFDPIDDNN